MQRARRPFRKSRRRPTTWFVPGFGSDPDFPHWGSFSCWADEAVVITPTNILLPPGGGLFHSPIVWNLEESIDPTVDARMLAHPLSERWRVERIVGQVYLATEHNVLNPPDNSTFTGLLISMGILRTQTATDGTATLDVDPALNANASRPWLWLNHLTLADDHAYCFTCAGEKPCNDGNGCGEHASADGVYASAYEVFGYPTAAVVPIDVRVRRTIRPEDVLSLHISCIQTVQRDTQYCNLGIIPKLRCLLTRTV